MKVPVLATRDFRRTTLSSRQRRMMGAIAEALFSPDGEPLEAGMLEEFVTDIDGFMSAASKPLRAGLVLMLEALRWLPVFVVGRLTTFEEMPIATRTLMLERMDRSRLSFFPLIVVAFKTMLALAYFEDESRMRAIGYLTDERKRYLTVVG